MARCIPYGPFGGCSLQPCHSTDLSNMKTGWHAQNGKACLDKAKAIKVRYGQILIDIDLITMLYIDRLDQRIKHLMDAKSIICFSFG